MGPGKLNFLLTSSSSQPLPRVCLNIENCYNYSTGLGVYRSRQANTIRDLLLEADGETSNRSVPDDKVVATEATVSGFTVSARYSA